LSASSGSSSSCGSVADENGFADTADQYGPEPAEEERTHETAEGCIKEDSVSRAIGQKSGDRSEDKSGNSTGEENEFHDEWLAADAVRVEAE
jgi:hypothetical protein